MKIAPFVRLGISKLRTWAKSSPLIEGARALARDTRGAVAVTYTSPAAVAGGTVAPTALQALNCNRVAATVVASADADTTATITHSFGLSATQLTNGELIVIATPILQATAALSLWAVTSYLTNTAVATKATTGSSGSATAQLRVDCLRFSLLN